MGQKAKRQQISYLGTINLCIFLWDLGKNCKTNADASFFFAIHIQNNNLVLIITMT